MKQKLFFFVVAMIYIMTFSSCSNDDEEYCWNFKTRVSTTIQGNTDSVITDSKQCGLTEDQAEEIKNKLNTTTTSTQNGYKVTVKTEVISMTKVSE